ncbi:MAG: hypothetical protein KF838_00290 [Phycisphaeraceae bacterium]|nr:MAG: hypothetical protein KF838_00290 [Phycisphaeraceae bacterium]
MNELLNRLLSTETLRFGDQDVRFGLTRPLEPWGWALVVTGAVLLAMWAYWKLDSGRRARVALATVRAMLIVFLVLLVLGPRLERQNETIEPDWVVVMADRSASMSVADVDVPGRSTDRITRDEQLREALSRAHPSLQRIAAERELLLMGFDGAAFPIRTSKDDRGLAPITLPPATGSRTSLSSSLSQALARTAARPVAGVILLSDGRTTEPPDRTLLRRLQSDRVPVFPLALGSPTPIGDLAVTQAVAPTVAFVRDTIPVSVRIERRGDPENRLDATVELIDQLTGRVYESRPLSDAEPDPTDPAAVTLTLSGSDTDAGSRDWSVRIVPTRADLIAENNTKSFAVDLLDRPIRTVYFDGYPRWEYRYVKNLLIREGSIKSSNLLLAVEKRFLQEGDELLRSLPRSSEEWAPFDVVVLGDLRPDLFTTEQLQQIREHVAMRGGGLLWIAGPGSTPNAWGETPLADLLPFAIGSDSGAGMRQTGSVRAWDRPVVVRPAPASERLGLLNLSQPRGWPAQLADPDTGWSLLRWAQRIEPGSVKPSAETLAFAHAADGQRGASPLVLTMRYGAGRVIYVATDETWRWRYARGETLQERFWLPLVRLLARDSVGRTGLPAVLELSQSVVPVEQPVRIAVRLLDQSLVDAAPSTIRVRLVPIGENSIGRTPIDLRLQQESDGVVRGGIRTYADAWVALEPGEYRVEASEPMLAGIGLQQPLSIVLPDNEMRTPETDHALLAVLAQETGGRMLTLQDLENLEEVLPNRQVRIVTPPTVQTLWDTPLALICFLLLACTEWIGRKLIRLV